MRKAICTFPWIAFHSLKSHAIFRLRWVHMQQYMLTDMLYLIWYSECIIEPLWKVLLFSYWFFYCRNGMFQNLGTCLCSRVLCNTRKWVSLYWADVPQTFVCKCCIFCLSILLTSSCYASLRVLFMNKSELIVDSYKHGQR